MKSRVFKIISCFVLLISLSLMVSSCRLDIHFDRLDPVIRDAEIEHETEFGGFYIKVTTEEMEEAGFSFGDSVTVRLSNGIPIPSIPYYNGYYTQAGELLLVGYPGNPYVKLCINNGPDLYEGLELTDDIKVNIDMSKKGKFLDIQEARDISYTDVREDYPSDEAFGNFRSLVGGALKENTVYRSASPCDNLHLRAPYVDALISQAGIDYIMNLADTEEKIEGYIALEDFDSPYFLSLYQDNKVDLVGLNMNYQSNSFKSKVVNALTEMANAEGPYLIHCLEGKDRTGFVCMIIELIAGASYSELVVDYMITYDNYYKINLNHEYDKYRVIVENVFDPMLESVVESDDFENIDLKTLTINYLIENGMTLENIDLLLSKICE